MMRRDVDAGTPLIVLTCAPGAYHLLVDGIAYERAVLLLRAALQRLERHLAPDADPEAVSA